MKSFLFLLMFPVLCFGQIEEDFFNPNSAFSYNNRGIAKRKLKDYNGAIAYFNKAIELNPNYASAYCNRGFAKSMLKDYNGAIADYNKAIELNPNYASAYKNRGISKANLGKPYCSDYKKACELVEDPTNISSILLELEELKGTDKVCEWYNNQCR